MGDLPRLRRLEGKAQAGFALPADLARRQRAAPVAEAELQLLELLRRQRADDVDDEFLLDLAEVVGQLADHAPGLGQDQQAGSLGLQG
ncbi:hypothetical protein D3C81_1518210 [compost metagenome]